VTSGDRNGSPPSQSMQRNLRPPVLTSINRMGLRHFGQVGGGAFFGMALTLGSGASAVCSLSPMTADYWGGDERSLRTAKSVCLPGIRLKPQLSNYTFPIKSH
jgi:hypothetical protein